MTTLGFILVLYVLPMVISGLIHYFDPKVKTLGDFMDMWWAIFMPFLNIVIMICVPFAMFIEYIENKNWLQRIKDIKIKSVIIIFCSLFFSCGNSEMSKKEYNKLKNISSSKGVIGRIDSGVGGDRDIKLYVIDSCEYIGYIGNYNQDFLTHKGNCKFCTKN